MPRQIQMLHHHDDYVEYKIYLWYETFDFGAKLDEEEYHLKQKQKKIIFIQ